MESAGCIFTVLITQSDYRSILDGLRQFETKRALYSSQFYSKQGSQIESIINKIWQQPSSEATPKLRDFVRMVQWNIERGKQIDAITALFKHHPVLSHADIITLNEVDLGMNRTANSNIAFELGSHLNMHTIFVAEYLELTKGIRHELEIPGENKEALHGNAILSRYPLKNARAVRLPDCFDTFQFSEKRYGGRVALIAEVEIKNSPLLIISTHLEVRDTPACRKRQFKAILDNVASYKDPAIIGGDLNTGTFKRGHSLRTALAILRLLVAEPDRLKYELRHPEFLEPIFKLAEKHGFTIDGFNNDETTCSTALTGIDESIFLPLFIARWIYNRLAVYNNRLDFRLDFILARNLKPVAKDQIIDSDSGVSSISPETINGLEWNGEPVSDHAPIVADFKIL